MISFTTTPNISILPESQQSNFNFRRTSSRLHLGKENLGVSYISEKCVFLFKQINKMTVRERKLAYLYAQVHRLLIKACSQGYIVVTEVMEINHEEETNGCVSMPQMIQTKMKSFWKQRRRRQHQSQKSRVFLFMLRTCTTSTTTHHFPSPYTQKKNKLNRKPRY